jgi:hypothetical protein
MAPGGGRGYDAGMSERSSEIIFAVEQEGKLHIWIDLHGDDGMRLDKEEVAVRQLDTAIRLLFDGGDVVSVHTLACAAADVFRDILKGRRGETWRDAIIERHPGMEREIHRTLARAQNFFKHAGRDPEAELDFDEDMNEETIIVATLEYGELLRLGARSGRTLVTTPMSVFNCFLAHKHTQSITKSRRISMTNSPSWK